MLKNKNKDNIMPYDFYFKSILVEIWYFILFTFLYGCFFITVRYLFYDCGLNDIVEFLDTKCVVVLFCVWCIYFVIVTLKCLYYYMKLVWSTRLKVIDRFL